MARRRSLSRIGSSALSGAGVPSNAVGADGDVYFRTGTNAGVYVKTAGSWGAPVVAAVLASLLSGLTTFDISLNSTGITAVPAAVNVGSLTLLTDAITAIGTLQTGLNKSLQLNVQIIKVLQAAGLSL